jgi:hypothetical protein
VTDADDTRAPDQALRADFLKALHDDFAAHGVAAIVAYREEKPADYLKIIASILPKEAGPKRDALEGISDDELLARIRVLDAAYRAACGSAAGGTPAPEGGAEPARGDAQTAALPSLP